jgi:predicted amidohydrolase YtcJ
MSDGAWQVVEPGWRGADLEVAGAKLFADGSLGSRTAWMHEPYSDGTTGMPLESLDEIREQAEKAANRGFAVAVHAIGNLAVNGVLEVFRGLARRTRRRLRLEHAQHVRDEDLDLLARLPVAASMQPCHLPGDVPFIRTFLKGREHEAFRFRDLWDRGVPLAFGSDAPVFAPDLGAGLAAATAHDLWNHQSLTLDEAVWAFTRGAATAAGWRDCGVLKPEARADLALWEHGRIVARVWKGNLEPTG